MACICVLQSGIYLQHKGKPAILSALMKVRNLRQLLCIDETAEVIGGFAFSRRREFAQGGTLFKGLVLYC